MAVQLTFDKSREIFKTLGTLNQGSLKLRFQITPINIIVETEYTTTRSTRAAAESISIANAYNRDLSQFRTQITMKMQECVRAQLAQTGDRKLDSQVTKDLTQEINSAIEGLRKLKEDQYKTDEDKSAVIKRIIDDDFQPLLASINPPAAASASGSLQLKVSKDDPPPSMADLPAEFQRLKSRIQELEQQVGRLSQQPSQASPSSSKRDTLMVILIALNVVVIAIQVVNFFQEG